MINKDSLLDAYMTLSGSPVLHISMLISLLVVMGSPNDLEDGELKDRLEDVYRYSLSCHLVSFIILSITSFHYSQRFKITQIAETVVVILNICVLLICVQAFSTLQDYDLIFGGILSPDKFEFKCK